MNIIKRSALLLMITGFFPLLLVAQNTVNVTPGMQRKPSKSKSEAMHLSLINTVMPVGVGLATAGLVNNRSVKKIGGALVIYGLLTGPSTGNFYADDYLRGSLGIAVRFGSGILLADATREVLGGNVADPLGLDNDPSVKFTDTKILVGSILFLGSMVYNVLSAKSSVEEYNAQVDLAMGVKVPPASGPVPVLTATIHL